MKNPIILFTGGLLLGLAVIAGVVFLRPAAAEGIEAETIAADSVDVLAADSAQLAEGVAGDDGVDDDVDSADIVAAHTASDSALAAASASADTADGGMPTDAAGGDVVTSTDVVTSGDVGSAGDVALDRARLVRILGVMKPAEAARILAELSDEEAVAVLGALSDRKAALLLAGLPPERAAAIGRIAMGERSGR